MTKSLKPLANLQRLDSILEPILHAARIPGAAIAIVFEDEIVFAKGYGYRDVQAQLPVTPDTLYPIASTSKAMNATILGMLVDEGRVSWDAPVQDYLPSFRLRDLFVSSQVTLRDLLVMRTGLPRHDWLWTENPLTRAELVERLRFLEPSAGFRERFQYNNVTAATAGYLAEVITGQSWEDLARERIFTPLCMTQATFAPPSGGDTTLSYHENADREMVLTRRFATEITAPSGGSIHSSVTEMARWMIFNLTGGHAAGRPLIQSKTLTEIRSPQVAVGTDPAAPTPGATYAMGWFVDSYNGRVRHTHGGYLHDVCSELSLFPEDGIGVVSFVNFGCSGMARLLNQYVFDTLQDLPPTQTYGDKLAQYEKKIGDVHETQAALRRVKGTAPSHLVSDYVGVYEHPGYGAVEVCMASQELQLHRNRLVLPLEHWHYDAWMVKENDLFPIHAAHAFDRANPILFDTSVAGEISGVSIRLELAVAPIYFKKRQ